MARIDYSPLSLLDLEQIGDYIENELMSPQAAFNTVNKIQDLIDKLSIFPLMGATLKSIVNADIDYRVLVCDNYLAFYHTDEIVVYIDRILYGKRDYLAILFSEL
ncbi:MAG: type II toxin-antitoxin system RelE/ParE family toxin [Oscillospiraceae bacterium]|nr:type II toxin-antitoxin system RelE/ParE family toxin [Oscillospiraceae bacterium]